MKNILIIKAGSTFEEIMNVHGEFDRMVMRGIQSENCIVADVENGEELPELSGIAGVVMTGSHSMVSDRADWSEYAAVWVRRAVTSGVPFLGICYGHQLLAHALGGESGYNPSGLEIGTARISRLQEDDPIFSKLPDVFYGHVIHKQSALKLPDGAIRLAENDHDANHAFRVGEHAWGVQFHPEFNSEIIRGYVERYKDETDYEQSLNTIRETPEASSVLKFFADYCLAVTH